MKRLLVILETIVVVIAAITVACAPTLWFSWLIEKIKSLSAGPSDLSVEEFKNVIDYLFFILLLIASVAAYAFILIAGGSRFISSFADKFDRKMRESESKK